MLKVVLTGYSGFIAQNLEKTLKKADYSVIGMPREILYNMPELIRFFDLNKPDFIIHTAAYGNKYTQDNDLETVYVNVVGLMNLLEMTRDLPYQGFINFSSSSVGLPYETFYSATKSAGERLIRAFVNKYHKPIVSVRPFTVIGKGEQQEHLIPELINSCLLEKDIPFVDKPVHDFIGVQDLCDAVLCLMQYTESLKGQIIDIGTGIETSNKEVKKLVEKVTGKKAVTHTVDSLRPYDAPHWVAKTDILEYLGWTSKQSIEDIIKEMV